MGRMLGFMLFPREGAAGGAWSFLLSPVSAAVADLPLALFVCRSPLAVGSLRLPLTACFALTVVCGTTFDRERLMETGIGTRRRRRVWLPVAVLRRNAAAITAGLLLAVVPAGVAAAATSSAGLHSWSEVVGSSGVGQHGQTTVGGYAPLASQPAQAATRPPPPAAGLAGT